MIINFSVQNFGSIKDKQTLSFEATKSTHLENTYVVHIGGLRLLKVAMIYGANASGKTTVLKALDFLRGLVLEPEDKKTDELHFDPFLFDIKTPKQSSIISIEFLQHEIKYFYEIEFSKKAVLREELYFHNPNKANIFKRKTDLLSQYTQITFGNKIKNDKSFAKNLQANTLWNNTVLGGYLKTNIDFQELHEVLEWFESYLNPLIYGGTKLEEFVTSKIDKAEVSKIDVVNILKKADLNISDIVIKKKDVPQKFLDFLKMIEGDDAIKELEEQGKTQTTVVDFEHTVNNRKFSLPLELESQGTKRYYGFAGILALLLKNPTAFAIDELEASLHPDLYLHFLLSFLLNSKKSQLITTTHNREIFNNRDIFRNDAIWFTNKDENCATELYSLSDFDSSTVRNTTNIFNAYKSGKLNATPNLADPFIDLVR